MKKILVFLSLTLSLAACRKDNTPDDASITGYNVIDINQSEFTLDNVYIDEPSKTIYLLFAGDFSVATFPLEFTASFNLTTGATSVPASGAVVTFSDIDDRFQYILTAADGTKISYYVVLRDNQIPNSDFEDWYSETGLNGKSFNEPGTSAVKTVWATANMGTSTFGLYCTTPVMIDANKAARIVTGETSMIPVTAGTLFTGRFDVNGAIDNPTDPKKATDFGIPFSLRPVSLSFRYTYQPGSRYVKATLKNKDNIFGGFTVSDMEGTDMFTSYAVLEKRDDSGIVEIGRTEMTSGDLQEVMREVTLPFTYYSGEKPTHIYVVFASSKDGDLFTGAVGSTLVVDDVTLNY